ncbi:dienelactone hydrolase family protein [Rossellomorea marisflavi]|uniref:dienelactone hydrolase family protein n=1 Tax=Rossellomorea marisflavi TaxID=189381 RepID=UPI00064E52FC|nr:dienelactone hydrolase family protein [Rossellomorea marisflavi]KML33763.1 hypothetical protein VL12_08955 [Rossellomorea marisflavi]
MRKWKAVVVLLHEIYGLNDHMKHYEKWLRQQGFEVVIPSLIPSMFSYKEEEVAYESFMNEIGFQSASKHAREVIEECSRTFERVYVVGFSIGATIAWMCSPMPEVKRTVCFYGSRIRDYGEIRPQSPTLLLYGESEPSFPVEEFIRHIKIEHVTALSVAGSHGFADPFSKRFHKPSYEVALSLLSDHLHIKQKAGQH